MPRHPLFGTIGASHAAEVASSSAGERPVHVKAPYRPPVQRVPGQPTPCNYRLTGWRGKGTRFCTKAAGHEGEHTDAEPFLTA